MKHVRSVAIALLLTLPASSVGCATYWEAWRRDPIAQTQTILQTVSTIVSVARVAFGAVKARLPEADRDAVQARFDKALIVVAGAESAIRSTLDAAAALDQPEPNLKAALLRLVEAAEALQDVVGVVRGGLGAAAPIPGYDELQAEVAGLRKRAGL